MERSYVAIALPHWYSRMVSRPALLSMIVVPWVIGLGDTLPVYYGISGQIFVSKPIYGYCAIRVAGRVYGRALWPTIGECLPPKLDVQSFTLH